MFIIPPIGRMIHKDAMFAQLLPALLVFVVLVGLALFSWRSTEATLETQQQRALEADIAIIETGLSDRIHASSNLLRAGVGLFEAGSPVNRTVWKKFFDTFSSEGRFRGVSVVGYVQAVPRAEKVAFEQKLQNEYNGNYKLQSGPEADGLAPVLYVKELEDIEEPPIGYNMYEMPELKQAINAARDSGQTIMTDIVDTPSTEDSGVLLFAPVYANHGSVNTIEQRRIKIKGYVYVAIHTQELFQGMSLNDADEFGYTVGEANDTQPGSVFASKFVRDNPEAIASESSVIEMYGRRWNVTYYATPAIVSPAESARPLTVLMTGLILATISAVGVYFLIKYRTRMFAISEEQKLQQAKDELLSLASHQLRTPATGVKQYLGMVIDGFAGAIKKDQSRLLEQAYKSNERQLQIINEFLYVAKLGSGSLTTTRHQFDLAPVVRDVYEEMKIDIQDKHHKVSVRIPRTVPVYADEHSVRMIIENLLSNAIKYTPPGGSIAITVKKSSREVAVSVADTGIGIDKKDIPLLFKQFSRIPNELSVEVSGSGIGLYLAQQLAIRNGGYISVESERGEGSTFTAHIPVRRVKNITKPDNKS